MADVENPTEITSRTDRPTGSMPGCDTDLDPDDPASAADATWSEVFTACCVKTPKEWLMSFVGFLSIFFFMYFFLVGIDFIGTGAKVMSGCAAGHLFPDETNPIAGLSVGVLATILLQSSSTTTSLVISLAGSDIISTKQGIYFIMGANIGTTVTNTLVSLAHLGVPDEIERAFAGATIHDAFNYLTVAVLLPLEVTTGYLFHLTEALVKHYQPQRGEAWEGPISRYIEPLGMYLLIENKKVTEAVAKGGICDDFYPIVCEDMDNPTKDGCTTVGLISCHEDFGCPAFFDTRATSKDDVLSGVVVFVIGIALLFSCLFLLIKILNNVIWGVQTRIIQKATNVNPYLAIVIGLGLTTVVQSSSVVTSTFTPFCGVGVLSLEQMFPLTLGANLGTTLTGILVALLSDVHAMQVALAHLFFNVTGVLIWFPLPFMRAVPLAIARFNGRTARGWRVYPFFYIFFVFFFSPLSLLGISTKFASKALNITCGVAVIIVFLFLAWSVEYYSRQWSIGDGQESRWCHRFCWWRRALPAEDHEDDSSDSDEDDSFDSDEEDSFDGHGEDPPKKTLRFRPSSKVTGKGSQEELVDEEELATKSRGESNSKSGISVMADVTAFSVDDSE